MISRHVRFALLGAAMGLVVALTPGCQKKCSADTCSGCCTAANECVTATSTAACGTGGAACATCAEGQDCAQGACLTPMPADAGEVDAGPPPCRSDFDCRALNNGSICDVSTGACIVGLGCRFDAECQSLDPENRCYKYGQQCVCDQNDKPAGNEAATGTCRVRKGACEACTSDRECGDDAIIFGPPDGIGAGRCKALPGDTTGAKYCLYQRVGQCACGTIDDGTGFCRPQSNSCNDVGCNVDKDCPSGAVCTVNNPDAGAGSCGGVCKPRCRWDFNSQQLIAPGCPPGETCWVDSANLDPSSNYYGSGRCKPACQGDADCKRSAGNPFGGDNLKCAGEKLADGTTSPEKRCRANGECMDNAECPELPNDKPYLGYCDRGSFACKSDCRSGTDPVTGVNYKDCRAPYACASDAGVNFCRLLSCVEQGGATLACSQGQYCCGEDKNRDGNADPCPPPAEQDLAGCYKAPSPPFCTQCMEDVDCRNVQAPAWLTCPNGSPSPSCSQLPMLCMSAGPRGMAEGIKICAPATHNDLTLDANGRRGAALGCPANYRVTWVRPQPNPAENVGLCQTDADCNMGTDAGACEPDPELRLQDGGLLKSCRCTAGSPVNQCPTTTDGGIVSMCRSGVSGQRGPCIESVVCMPPGQSTYLPVDQFGCGL